MQNVPYFVELREVSPYNHLHEKWIAYALTFSQSDIEFLVRNGLTHQARSLRSMVREVIGGRAVPPRLTEKLDLMLNSTISVATKMRE